MVSGYNNKKYAPRCSIKASFIINHILAEHTKISRDIQNAIGAMSYIIINNVMDLVARNLM